MDFGVFKHLLDEAERLAPKPPKRPPPSGAGSEEETPIPEYILSLGRNDRIRDIAENLLSNRPVDSGVLWELLSAVESAKPYSWRRGIVAAWSISRLRLTVNQRNEAASRLNEVLTRRVGSYHTNSREFRTLYAFVGLSAIAYLSIATTGGPFSLRITLFVILMTSVLYLVATRGSIDDTSRIQRLRSYVAETLGVLASPESVEVLTETAVEVASRASQPAREALVKVLPEMSEEWRGRLSAATIEGLCRILPEVDGFDALVILRALERVGPGSAAASVDWAIKDWARGPVREEGERVLAVLRERHAKEKESASLLRAASDSGERTLLRAKTPAVDSDSAELLRPLDSAG